MWPGVRENNKPTQALIKTIKQQISLDVREQEMAASSSVRPAAGSARNYFCFSLFVLQVFDRQENKCQIF